MTQLSTATTSIDTAKDAAEPVPHDPRPVTVAEYGGNVAIVGPQGAGKTTLLKQFIEDEHTRGANVYVAGVLGDELDDVADRVTRFERGPVDVENSPTLSAVRRKIAARLDPDNDNGVSQLVLVIDNADIWAATVDRIVGLADLEKITVPARKVNLRVIVAATQFSYDTHGSEYQHTWPSRILLAPWTAELGEGRTLLPRWERSPYGRETQKPGSTKDKPIWEYVGDLLIPRRLGVALAVTDPDDVPELVQF
jgi:hypothetical protein